MIHGRLFTTRENKCVIPKVSRTTNFLERMRGLLFSPPLGVDEAILIEPCRSVHTMGMSYAIDLVFLDVDWKIVKIVSNLKPWRSASCARSIMVLEMMENSLKQLNLSEGQQLEWHNEI